MDIKEKKKERKKRKKKPSPVSKTPSLQSAGADFKEKVIKVAMQCVDEADERESHTCQSRPNRLEKLSISNRQVAIQGMPAISDEDRRYIAKALLAMRGVNQKIHKALHDYGHLKLHPVPFTYKGTSHAWIRNLRSRQGLEDWTKEPALPDGPARRKQPLDSISCPECETAQDTKTHRLPVKVGFCQLRCKQCQHTVSTKQWRCTCGLP